MLLPVCVWRRCTYVSLWVCMCPCMCPWCIWKGYITPHIIFSETGSLAGLQLTICFEWLGSKLLKSCCFLPSVRSQAWTAIVGFWLGAQGPHLDPHAWIANTLPTKPSHQVNQFNAHNTDEKVEISHLALSPSSWMTWESHSPFEVWDSLFLGEDHIKAPWTSYT